MSLGRRKHARVSARAGDVSHAEFTCLDISESGMKLSAMGKVGTGGLITVTLNALEPPVEVRCRVMWCREASSVFDTGYHFGVKFENFSIQNQAKLRELIDSRG